MTTRALILAGAAFAIVLQACRYRGTPAPSASPACEPHVRWSMPAMTNVERTAADSRSKEQLVSQARIDAFILAAEAACRSNGGAYPESLDGLLTLPDQASQCRLRHTDLHDGWGRAIFYGVVGDGFIIRSAGPDGLFATPDDIGPPTLDDPHAETFDLPVVCYHE